MKKTATIVTLVLLFAYTGCRAQSNTTAEEAALSAARAWLVMVDGEHYGESWDEAAAFFRGAVTRDNWIQAMQSIRPKPTEPSRSPARAKFAISSGTSPQGQARTQLAQRIQGIGVSLALPAPS